MRASASPGFPEQVCVCAGGLWKSLGLQEEPVATMQDAESSTVHRAGRGGVSRGSNARVSQTGARGTDPRRPDPHEASAWAAPPGAASALSVTGA